MEKTKVINRLVFAITVIGFILLILGLLSLFGIINMNSMLLTLSSAGIFNLLNANYNIKNKKTAIFFVIVGFFSIFVAVFKTLGVLI